MSSWRHDPLTDRTVRIAPARQRRPNEFASASETPPCPFCEGAEDQTPAEVERVADASGRWLARVVPNLYPIVTGDDGAHEVVIESPRHTTRWIDLTDAEATAAVTAWGRRLAELGRTRRWAYRLLFKNEGPLAGASLAHTHSQLVALPETPGSVAAMWRRIAAAPAEPLDAPQLKLGCWSVASPIAPRLAGETWLVPDRGAVRLDDLATDEAAAELASLLQRVLAAIEPAAFNLVLQAPPADAEVAIADRWWVEIVPRSASVAGFELATGAWINSASPEATAQRLRNRLGP